MRRCWRDCHSPSPGSATSRGCACRSRTPVRLAWRGLRSSWWRTERWRAVRVANFFNYLLLRVALVSCSRLPPPRRWHFCLLCSGQCWPILRSHWSGTGSRHFASRWPSVRRPRARPRAIHQTVSGRSSCGCRWFRHPPTAGRLCRREFALGPACSHMGVTAERHNSRLRKQNTACGGGGRRAPV